VEPGITCACQIDVTTAAAIPLPAAGGAYDGRMRLHDASDEWLAARAKRGDADAFEQLVLRYQDRLYTLALRVTLSEADARDCVQEGLISAWRAIDRFRGDARFSTWIYRIVIRKAYDALDRRKRWAVPAEAIEVPDADRSPEDRLDLMSALAGLDPEFRAAVVACDIVGMSMDEAAAALDVPAGTVKSRLSRARERLAQQLEANRTP
jgi:RNA polymerase sigma-70 factor, ECF subfamily